MSSTSPTSVDAVHTRYGPLLDHLHAAHVSDSLDALGARDQVLCAAIRPLDPSSRALGPAMTIQFVPTEHYPETDPYADFIEYMDSMQAGSIAVMATASPERSALWGELFSAAALGRGARAVVTDGLTRDTAQIKALGFPTFSAGTRPIDYRGRQVVTSRGQTVMCGGVRIAQDDWILAEEDGVVVIPQALLFDCLDAATARLAGESNVLGDLLAGDHLSTVWDRYGLL